MQECWAQTLSSGNRYADDLNEGKRKKTHRRKSYIVYHKYLQSFHLNCHDLCTATEKQRVITQEKQGGSNHSFLLTKKK